MRSLELLTTACVKLISDLLMFFPIIPPMPSWRDLNFFWFFLILAETKTNVKINKEVSMPKFDVLIARTKKKTKFYN